MFQFLHKQYWLFNTDPIVDNPDLWDSIDLWDFDDATKSFVLLKDTFPVYNAPGD